MRGPGWRGRRGHHGDAQAQVHRLQGAWRVVALQPGRGWELRWVGSWRAAPVGGWGAPALLLLALQLEGRAPDSSLSCLWGVCSCCCCCCRPLTLPILDAATLPAMHSAHSRAPTALRHSPCPHPNSRPTGDQPRQDAGQLCEHGGGHLADGALAAQREAAGLEPAATAAADGRAAEQPA